MTKVIGCGIRYYNSNSEVLNDSDRKITDTIYENSERIERASSYQEKLKVWQDLNLHERTEHWIGDFSKIKKNYQEYSYPEPDCFLSVHPKTHEQVIKFNLFNLTTAIEEVGNFKTYKEYYLRILDEQRENPLVKVKIRNDLHNLKNQVPSNNYIRGGLVAWFESFRDTQDTLRESNYVIFKDEPIVEYSKKAMFSGSAPYLRYLLDDPKYVFEAANGYLLAQKIPFLQELTALFETAPTTSVVTNIVIPETNKPDTQIEENTSKKSKKKNSQITTKQQMILLNALGFLNASIISNSTTIHKAAILAQLLNRSEQEIRCMLMYGQGVNVKKDYDCSNPDDLDIVMDLLRRNNLKI